MGERRETITQPARTRALRPHPGCSSTAVAMSSAHLQLVDTGDPAALRIGWVTYIARQRGKVPPLPAPVRIEPVDDEGALIVLTSERFTASNPDHVASAERVTELLDRAGLVRSVAAP
ncbi:Imm52 family immunity protein [Myxococcus vastator]|uniref:Imm52 family immunity protein n=1 Tax=Myxococcus vastator TaxID=2709664 RepID=UPI0013D19C97